MTRTIILAIAPSSATGGALIHSSILKLFAAEENCEVHFWGLDKPFDYDPSSGIIYHFPDLKTDNSPAIQNTLKYLTCIEEIVTYAKTQSTNEKQIILFGSFLFPFCNILYQSAVILKQYGIKFKLIIQPTGSDIWRLSSNLKEISKVIFDYSETILAYSHPFADEIKQICSSKSSIKILPPFVDTYYFQPVSSHKKKQLRIGNGIPVNSLVFSCVSNMRFVKGIPNTIYLASRIALQMEIPTYLLLVGPLTSFLSDCLQKCQETKENNDYIEYKSGVLLIRHYGLKNDVRLYYHLSDFSINTSYHDSFNTALSEAMACGIPIISSSAPGIFSFSHETVGYIYKNSGQAVYALQQQQDKDIPENEVCTISRFVIEYSEAERYRILSNTARDFIVTSFSKDVLRHQYKKIIE